MKAILNQLLQHQRLSKEEAKQVLLNMATGVYTPAQMAAFLTVYLMRSIALEELEGFRAALLELCIPIDLSEFDAIDLCGTGGDEKNTFNISTLSAFVTAGAGVQVTKHGNYGVSSACGSSNVLEALGIKFSNEADFLKRAVDKAGICILHAPLFHPAMKNVAPVRKELGVKTFFNMLGPLVNPAFPKYQITGVFSLELARMYSYLFQKTNTHYTVLYDLKGYDEISLTGTTKAYSRQGERLITPHDFGVDSVSATAIAGGETVASSATIFMAILNNTGSEAQQHVVCANAGMAIATVQGCSPREGFEKAKEALASGKALQAFKTLQHLSQS